MKQVISILLVTLLAVFSCKKKENTPESTPTPSTPPALIGVSFNGLCSNQLWTTVSSTSTFTINFSQNVSYMAASDFTNFNPPTGMNISSGKISLNGINFKNIFNYNLDTTYAAQQSPFVWQATGGTVPAFSYTNTNTYPTFTGYTAWTDTISKSTALTLSLSGMTNMDEAYIHISNTNSSSPAATGTLLASTTNFSFSPSALSSLSTSTTVIIQIDIYKNNIQTISGKKINFRNVGTFVKTVQVKN